MSDCKACEMQGRKGCPKECGCWACQVMSDPHYSVCPAWTDGQHCYVALLEARMDLASDIPIGHASYTRKVCICGAEVQRVKPQK